MGLREKEKKKSGGARGKGGKGINPHPHLKSEPSIPLHATLVKSFTIHVGRGIVREKKENGGEWIVFSLNFYVLNM